MRYLPFLIGFLLSGTSCSSQVIEQPKSCNCKISAFTASIPNEEVRICIDKNGFTVMELNFPYGEDNEESIFFYDVKACDEGWLNILDKNSNGFYWIEPRSLETTSKHNGFQLYSSPNKKSTIYTTKQGRFLTILGCEGEWALVEFKTEEGKIIKGWIAPEDQCPNPFTSCS